jgi:hypothetical protein
MQLFTGGHGFVVAYPMRTKGEAGIAIQKACCDIGVPNNLHMDNAAEQMGPNMVFQQTCRDNKINMSSTELHSPWQNACENIIGIIKKRAKGRRVRRRIPKCLWDFGIVWECEIYSRTANKHGRTGLEVITGDTIDISKWVDFEFYDLIKYWDT